MPSPPSSQKSSLRTDSPRLVVWVHVSSHTPSGGCGGGAAGLGAAGGTGVGQSPLRPSAHAAPSQMHGRAPT